MCWRNAIEKPRRISARLVVKATLCALLTMAFLFSVGCSPDARELNELIIVMGIGLDVDMDTPGNIKMTAQIVLPQRVSSGGGDSSSGGSERAFINVSSAASNTFQAVRQYTHLVPGKLYISHNQLIVIGRDLAEQGISRPLDFFSRARETRPTLNLLVADTTAEEAMSIQPDLNLMPANYLDKLIEGQSANSQSINTDMIDYVSAMQSKTLSLVVPIVRLTTNAGTPVQMLEGVAVFKGDVMVGELSTTETRGLLWAKNLITSGVVNLGIEDGIATFEIANAKSSAKPVVSPDGKVTIEITVSSQMKLTEQTCTANLATQEYMRQLKGMIETLIDRRIQQALEKAKALHADIFGYGELVHKHYNNLWGDMEPRWDEIFQELTVNVTADVSIISTGAIEEPVWDHEDG